MANMEDYMLIKIIININEKIVTDDVDHSEGAEARGMRRCQACQQATLSGSITVGGRVGGQGKDPLTYVVWMGGCLLCLL